MHIVQRVAEHLAAQFFAQCLGQHGAGQAVAFQAFVHQALGQQQHAAWRVHQRIGQLGVGVEGLVGGDGPGGGGPDHHKGLFVAIARERREAKGPGQADRVVGLEGHVQRVALLVGVFDLELGQAGAAVEAPVHGLQAAVDKAALDDALEGADLAGLVGRVHGLVGALPVAEHAQAFEVLALLVDLFGGVGAALGLHVVTAQVAAVQLFDGVFDGQAMAVPAGDVLRVEASQLLALDDHVLEHLVQRVADVQLAVGIGWAVVQHE